MSGKKENLKKSLGITEYPWSSDDEESGSPQYTRASNMRHQPGEGHSSAADLPGPSGLQPTLSPASARKHQAKMDRNLFWSIINNTPKPSNIAAIRSTPRTRDIPIPNMPPSAGPTVAPSSSSAMRDRSERVSGDIQRILAFKDLTRSLNSLTQNKPSNSVYCMSSRGALGSSRSPLFRPDMPAVNQSLAAAASIRASRVNRAQNSRRGYSSIYSHRHSSEPQASSSSNVRSRPLHTTHAEPCVITFAPELCANLDHSDEEPIEIREQIPEPNETHAEATPAEVSGHNSSGGGVSLEEEIVEVEPAEETPPCSIPYPHSLPTLYNENISEDVAGNDDVTAEPVTAESAEASQSQQGVKRKREGNDDRVEQLSSVKEFNQSLLRLLECPVCLEWMEPPISQCRRGHLVCARCRSRLATCPVCRTTFSSVRNRAMEGVAEMLRYPCRHGCGREVRLRRRASHESSCGARRYQCPAAACAAANPLLRQHLADHFQSKHMSILKIGHKHKFSMKVNSEQHETWLIMALDEFFHLRIDVDIRTWGVDVYVAYIGPKCNAKNYVYEVTVEGQHSARKLTYSRSVHSDLESPSTNVNRQDCFHLTLDQALNFLRFKNRHCESDKFLDFNVEITKCETNEAAKEDSES